jgi:hypothetical protein
MIQAPGPRRKQFYRLVYQGGHHDVWCNGETHVRLAGGRFGQARLDPASRLAKIVTTSCDCDAYSPKVPS